MNEQNIRKAARCLKMLGHPTRLEIIVALRDGPRCVHEINEVVRVKQANLSQHLSQLSDRGLLISRRESNRVYYSIADMDLLNLLSVLEKVFCKK